MKTPIHSFLMFDELKPLYQLCIRSFMEHGHHFILYTYNQNLKADCEVRDLREILPESEVFEYKNMMEGKPEFKYGGITERIEAEMLYKLGGWHVNMDVTCLQNFDGLSYMENVLQPLEMEYVFAPHPLGMVANIIKAPAGSELAKYYLNWTKGIDENNTEWQKSFKGLNVALQFLELQKYIVPTSVFGMDDENYILPLLKNTGLVPGESRFAIHWCNAMKWHENYEQGSFYHSLLVKYGLV